MMSVRLFVGNLAYDVTAAELRELFTEVGSPSDVILPTDRETGRPRGFAFVEFAERPQAEAVIQRFNQFLFKGRPLAVSEARPRGEGPPPRPMGMGPRPSSYAPPRPAWGGDAPAGDAPPRSEQPKRTFGPDAPPRGRRRPETRTPKSEGRPKVGPRERGGARRFVSPELEEEAGGDETPVWGNEESEEKE
jgi:RNA recognition motif-containing protein